jgi:signal transduction histidine kinase
MMAGGIAHDFNNLLTAIIGNIELVMRGLEAESPMAGRLGAARLAAGRAADLAAKMLAYSGRISATLAPVDLAELVRRHEGSLREAVPGVGALRLRLDTATPRIMADAGQVRQMLLQVAANAAEAIAGREGGFVEVAVETITFAASDLARMSATVKASPGCHVCLSVMDNGCGMDAEAVRRMFDPFFTTKFLGRGLGLSAVVGMVKQHRGAILVDSSHGVGTTIRILFPLPDTMAEKAVAQG